MAYVAGNPRTKKQLREMIADPNIEVYVFQPNGDITGATIPTDGIVYLEGPHFPEAHKWYAQGYMKNGKLEKIK